MMTQLSDEVVERLKEARWRHIKELPAEVADAMLDATGLIEGLEEALDPFARVAAINEPLAHNWPDDKPASQMMPGAWPTWGDLKRALRAIGGRDKL